MIIPPPPASETNPEAPTLADICKRFLDDSRSIRKEATRLGAILDSPMRLFQFAAILHGAPLNFPKPKAQLPAVAKTVPIVKTARVVKTTATGKIDLRTKEGRALKAQQQAIGARRSKPKPKRSASKRPKHSMKPLFRDAVAMVMGQDTLDTSKILERLTAKGWMPKGTRNIVTYLSFVLSSNTKLFERMDRGQYRLRQS